MQSKIHKDQASKQSKAPLQGKPSRLWVLIAIALFMSSCTCCLYLNHFYNAEKYYNKAIQLKTERLEQNPQDSLWVNKPETEALNKAIEKCSAILERWPSEAEYKPDVLFIMGESFLKLGQWPKAIQKYDEYLKYFPEGEELPTIEFHKALALARSGQPALARYALKPIIAQPKHPWHEQALTLMAKLQLGDSSTEEAIATLEALLKIPNGNPRLRAQAFYQLGELYFEAQEYKTSRERYRSPEIEILGTTMLYQALKRGVLSIFEVPDYGIAINDLQGILSQKRFESYKTEVEMLLARGFIQNQEFNQGIALLNKLKLEHPNTGLAAEAYFWNGDYYEKFPNDYPSAVSQYDSATQASPRSPYGALAFERVSSLKKLVSWYKSKDLGKVGPEYNFQIAELFLFDLNQTDSALIILDSIVEGSTNRPQIRMRAAYARAFIQDEFKKDTPTSDSLYQWIIQEFPQSQYAKQAQKNLGLEVTIQTNEDQAKSLFLKMENAYDELLKQDSLDPVTFDSLELVALSQFDSIAQKYPETQEAAHALYFKAYIYENQHFNSELAKEYYQKLAKDYYQTPWGERAQEKLNGKLTLTDERMKDIRKTHQRNMIEFEKRTKQLESRRISDEKKKEAAVKEEEEQLLWDYNDMYDIGR